MGRILLLGTKGEKLDQLKRAVESMGNIVVVSDFDNSAESMFTKKPDLAIMELTTRRGIAETWYQVKSDALESHTPIIVIVPEDRIRDIELLKGIQDFILYPYDPRELEIRIKLMIANHNPPEEGGVIKIGNLAIYTTRYEVTVGGWSMVLTLKEYELLKYLATHRGRVFTREILLNEIWGYNYYGGTRTVDVHIGRLRTKIESGDYTFIKTVRGVGYMFTDEYPEEID
jgi:two-component system alkaline phosphatase synthesis response regulator PhoP